MARVTESDGKAPRMVSVGGAIVFDLGDVVRVRVEPDGAKVIVLRSGDWLALSPHQWRAMEPLMGGRE